MMIFSFKSHAFQLKADIFVNVIKK